LSRAAEEVGRQALSQFLTRSALRHSDTAWIESCSRDAESMLGLERHEFADLLTRAAHAHHQFEIVTDRADENWADWYADYMLTHGSLARTESTEQPRGHQMQITPPAFTAKHEELLGEVAAVSKQDGPVGSAAREVEWVLRPHLLEEEEFALPALGALRAIVRRAKRKELQAMANMTDRLQHEMSDIGAQHAVVALAVEGLASAAEQAGDESGLKLAHKLADYAKMEESSIYPAIVLMGEIAKEELAKKTRTSTHFS
jgi:hypothetical protein